VTSLVAIIIIVIIIIIITIGKTAVSELRPTFKDSAGLHFLVFGYRNNLQGQAVQLPNLGDQVPVFMPPSDRVAQLYLEVPSSLFDAFSNSHAYGGDILTSLHTRNVS
jgi:hypothetical protein